MSGSWNTAAVDKFLRLVKTARDFNSKEVKLTIQDAEQLSLSLALVLNQERELTVKLMQCQEKLVNVTQNNAPRELSLNGGNFQ